MPGDFRPADPARSAHTEARVARSAHTRARVARSAPTRVAAALLAVLLAACSGSGETPSAQPAGSAGQPSVGQPSGSPDASPSAPPPSGPTYTNPVFQFDFPDPHVIRADDGTYYAYSTNGGTTNIPVIHSDDLVTWERLGDALPGLPAWAKTNFGFAWAPGVIKVGDEYLLYFVARDKASDRQCIGVARGDAPAGPFVDRAKTPLVCQADIGGSIDPYPFRDADGQLYLYWKNDGNCCAKPVGLWVQPLADDGLTLTGTATELIRRDQPWEVPLIENPAIVPHDGRYFLFYSANWWEGHEYAVGYAVCDSATGPCTKPLKGPWFQFTPEALGPGGQAFFTDAKGNEWMAYHAWTGPYVGYPSGARSLRIDPLRFENGAPVATGPTTDPQPLP